MSQKIFRLFTTYVHCAYLPKTGLNLNVISSYQQEFMPTRMFSDYMPLLLRQTTSELRCLSGDKRGDYQNRSVLYCVLKLCTVINTLRREVLIVFWIGVCHTGPISLCVDFVFICVYFVRFCFILHGCCIIVSKVG